MTQPVNPVDRSTVAARLRDFPRRASDRQDLKRAAVAVCITENGGVLSLLIIRRAPRLRAHAGQLALPGGRLDPGETAPDGALRELQEELGLTLKPDAVLGLLDDYVTRSGYVITPVVCWAVDAGEPTPAETEVAQVHQIALADLDVEPRFITIPESDAPVIQLPLLDRYLHAPTGAIVYQFCQVACRGLATRVAHFEQPVFAWQ
ncbi:MAG: putative hydrolase [Blastococcus sp.]|jgi:8-oxo-dGTP pyrophosphatase MutT (NUDIX family)|nr:putative hydrolase [Blastococcus sp.]